MKTLFEKKKNERSTYNFELKGNLEGKEREIKINKLIQNKKN